MRIRAAFLRFKNSYTSFVEKQGFAIISVICVAVITATAVWSRQEEVYVSPTPPVSQDISAAQLIQQTLRDASTPAPSPTQTPRPWHMPLDEYSVLRPFDADSMVQSGITGIWAVHDAVDLAAERGAAVCALADGVVLAAGDDQLQGVWLLIDHSDGVEALYAGLALHADYRPGDRVFAGDRIGYVGNGPLEESDLGSHLHLRITRHGQPIDPETLWASQ